MAYQKGDVVLVPFPFTDLSKTKVRPAVVVSTLGYEQATGSIIIAMLTSKAYTTPHDYRLSDWQQANLVKATWVRSKLATVDPHLVVHTIGQLSSSDLQEVEARLKLSLDV